MFNKSIKKLRDYELQSIDSLNNKSIAESEARKSCSRPTKEQNKMFSNYVWTLQELGKAE